MAQLDDCKKTIAKQQKIITQQQRLIAEQQETIDEQRRLIAEHLETIDDQKKVIRLHKTTYVKAESVLKALLELLTKLIELRDPYTDGHSKQVAILSTALAKHPEVGFPAEKLTALQYGSFLHDNGKVAISDFVLNKPTLLSRLERRMIEQHPEVGYELIEPLNLDPVIGNVIRFHHENNNGSGYPFGLVSEDIPLEARIVKLADVYDALTSTRPYRPAYSVEVALEIMEESREQFDPHLLKIFLEMIRKSKDALVRY